MYENICGLESLKRVKLSLRYHHLALERGCINWHGHQQDKECLLPVIKPLNLCQSDR